MSSGMGRKYIRILKSDDTRWLLEPVQATAAALMRDL
jgi:hypothetical protein